jgi:serine/threonine-protein kinase HipA
LPAPSDFRKNLNASDLRILALVKALTLEARQLQSEPTRDFTRHGVVAQIMTLIEQRCALTVRMLSVPAGDMDDETESSWE